MPVVNSADGIKYGFRLMGYLFGVGIISLVAGMLLGVVLGGALGIGGRGGLLIGTVFAIIGIQAGTLGLGYKVVADGVYTGVSYADS
jgi:hypothetical protein